ncbi:MAG: amine oxidase, partial [Candidatus Omnitrophota bacterium]
LNGLIATQKQKKEITNFNDWIYANFGKGIACLFMVPYNSKVWASPLNKMSYAWIGDRVSVVDFAKLKKNAVLKKDDVAWGPNNRFKFPLYGGTGGFFD